MQLGTVIGHATSTIKHRSLNGWRLALVQPIGAGGQPEADPVLAADKFGAASGQTVVMNLDGKAARETIGDEKTPVRYFVIGIVDEKTIGSGVRTAPHLP
jgi:ethanolamine utilization protein EutN